MKLINEKGKLFGIINVVDLLIILAAVLVAGGIGWKVFRFYHIRGGLSDTTLTMTVRNQGAHPRQYEEIMEHGLRSSLFRAPAMLAEHIFPRLPVSLCRADYNGRRKACGRGRPDES
jgi:hypothetical protein